MSTSLSVGLSSGIDYASLLSQLRQAGMGPINIASNTKARLQQQQNALGAIKKAFTDFQDKASALKTRDSFLTMTATSTDGTTLLANATSEASAGTYSVKVKQLAASDRIASQGVATGDTTSIANAAGSFKFQVGDGSEVSVDVSGGMTLNQLRDAINAKNSKVRASVINDGTATNAYRLVLTSSETGAANAIKLNQNDTTLNLSTGSIEAAVAKASNTFNGTATASGTYTGKNTKNIIAEITTAGAVGAAKYRVSYDGGLTWTANDAFTTSTSAVDVTGAAAEGVNLTFAAGTQDFVVGDRISVDAFSPRLQSAQDAIMEIDGVQVSRATNQFSDVVTGVTLTARQVDTDAITVQVLNSNNSVSTKINEFVTSYNTLQNTVKTLTKFDTESNQAAVLFGDSSVTQLLSQVRSTLTNSVPGLDAGLTFTSIGLEVAKDGTLSVNSTKLNDALNKKLDDVVKLFVEAGAGSSSDIKFSKAGASTAIGSYVVKITAAAEQATVVGADTLVGGLANDETLTINDKNSSVQVKLTAGSTLSQILSTLNQRFADKGLGLSASSDGGKLRITTIGYGSDEVVRVASNLASGTPGQLGIGNEVLSDAGVDVAGTIDGAEAEGDGRTLKGKTGRGKDLQLTISALAPMEGTFTLSRGIGQQLVAQIDAMNDSTSGVFSVRSKGYDSRIADYDKRIEQLSDRLNNEQASLKAKFNKLETQLAAMTAQGNQLTAQLAALIQ